MAGKLSVGQLVAFQMLAGQVSGPVLRLVSVWQQFQQARISIDRIGDIMKWIKTNVDLSPSGIIQRFNGSFPRYYNTALNGHYGKTDIEMQDEQTGRLYPWEKTDIVGDLLHFVNE